MKPAARRIVDEWFPGEAYSGLLPDGLDFAASSGRWKARLLRLMVGLLRHTAIDGYLGGAQLVGAWMAIMMYEAFRIPFRRRDTGEHGTHILFG